MTRQEWLQKTEAEQERTKVVHAAIKACLTAARSGELVIDHKGKVGLATVKQGNPVPHRYMLLTWAFSRGMPYRRVEPHHCKQYIGSIRPSLQWRSERNRDYTIVGRNFYFEHNAPNLELLTRVVSAFSIEAGDIEAWLNGSAA